MYETSFSQRITFSRNRQRGDKVTTFEELHGFVYLYHLSLKGLLLIAFCNIVKRWKISRNKTVSNNVNYSVCLLFVLLNDFWLFRHCYVAFSGYMSTLFTNLKINVAHEQIIVSHNYCTNNNYPHPRGSWKIFVRGCSK